MMDTPTLNLQDFEQEDSPVTILTPCINLGEFEEEASHLNATFCSNMMTVEEFEAEGATETERALKALIEHLENNPSTMLKLLQKKKQEELEKAGFISMVKSRVLSKVQGGNYKKKLVTENECKNKIEELTQGMMMVYSYAQETKGQRFSKRLAARRCLTVQDNSTPLKPYTDLRCVLGDKTNLKNTRKAVPSCSSPTRTQMNLPTVEQLKRPSINKRSAGSLVSVREELLLSNPLQKLRAAKQPQSPGVTPVKKQGRGQSPSQYSVDLSTPFALKQQTPLMQTFLQIFKDKFQNLYSPSSSNLTDNASSCD